MLWLTYRKSSTSVGFNEALVALGSKEHPNTTYSVQSEASELTWADPSLIDYPGLPAPDPN